MTTMQPGLGTPTGLSLPSRPRPSQGDPTEQRDQLSVQQEQTDDARSSSSASPVPADNEESDFYVVNNDSESSLGVVNIQDMTMNDDPCQPVVNRLPNEILMAIFSKLGTPADLFSIMLVCHQWARNAVHMLWHRPACTNWDNHLLICNVLGSTRPSFAYKEFIRRLNLAQIADQLNDGSVQPLAGCTGIERLTLTNCRHLTDSGLVPLIRGNSNLLALDVSNDSHITEQTILAIAEHCKRIQGLNFTNCENISNESLITLAQNCHHVKRLKLNECAQVRDESVYAFANNCPNILEIDLQQCAQVGNGPITSLLLKSNCLRELRLANLELLDDNAFLNISGSKTLEHLRILDLTACANLTDAAVVKIIDLAPRLRNVVLQKCRQITDVAINAISKLNKNLHYVHLGHCSLITDDSVKRLVGSCTRIRYIDLGCCTNLTDDSVKRLAFLPKLKRIGLVKCAHITDESVNQLADAAHRRRVRAQGGNLYPGSTDAYASSSLERVHLSYCINLTLKSIVRLLNACPRLTHLSLTGVAAFQRDDFQPFCRAAPPEFTQHQRDVFCVFSGGMVSEFRNFLNREPTFDYLREPRHRPYQPFPAGVPPTTLAGPQIETFEEEVFDEDNDNDFDATDMFNGVPGGNIPPPPPHHANGHAQLPLPTLVNLTELLGRTPDHTPGPQLPLSPAQLANPPPGHSNPLGVPMPGTFPDAGSYQESIRTSHSNGAGPSSFGSASRPPRLGPNGRVFESLETVANGEASTAPVNSSRNGPPLFTFSGSGSSTPNGQSPMQNGQLPNP